VAVDTLGDLLALKAMPVSEQGRAQVAELAAQVQAVTGSHVEAAFVDPGDSGAEAARQAGEHGIKREVVKHAEAKRGFVLLPRRWVVERTFGWLERFRRLARQRRRSPGRRAAVRPRRHACDGRRRGQFRPTPARRSTCWIGRG
jgi:transposase